MDNFNTNLYKIIQFILTFSTILFIMVLEIFRRDEIMYKYEHIYDDIKNKILSGELPAENKIPSEQKLCEIYGASRVTVNNALTKLQKKGYILRRVGDGSYVCPSQTDEKQRFVSFIMLSNQSENNEIIDGINSVLSPKNIRLTVSVSNDDAANEQKILDQLNDANISGLICYPYLDARNNVWKTGLSKKIPIVFLDRYPENVFCSCVLPNSYDGMYNMTEYVINKGHTDIAYLTFPLSPLVTMKERFNGFRDCMNAHGLVSKNGRISILQPQYRPYTEDDFEQNIIELLTNEDLPSAVICANDVLALSCIRIAQTLGLNVPKDISVTGFDDLYLSAHAIPRLTTMHQPFYEIGKTAAKLLLDGILNHSHTVSRVYLETTLIERDSVMQNTHNNIS